MAAPAFTPKIYTDFIGGLEAGQNSGVSPLLLQKNQISFGTNLSLRGGYAKCRPPFFKKVLDFGGDSVFQSNVETGVFQGAGYYRPDYGVESLLAQIGGRLIQFTENGTSWSVTDVSVPGDLNNPTSGQVWMWQSEKWMIVTDGTTALPIFFDGTVSRRSYGASVQIGNAIAFTPAAPPLDANGDPSGSVLVTLSTPYTGQYNVPVIFNGEFYQPVANPSSTYNASLTNIHATAGNTIPDGSQISTNPINVGYILTAGATQNGIIPGELAKQINFYGSAPNLIAGNTIIIEGHQWTVRTLYPGGNFLISQPPVSGFFPNATPVNVGDLVTYSSTTTPTVIIGTTVGANVIPAINSSISIVLNQPYSGLPNQRVWIGNDEYQISPPPTPPSTTSLTLINLTDTSVANYVNPTPIFSVPEIPSGRMGAYGMGRNWLSLVDGISYIGGDIVGGGSGTPANNFRDAVLKITENTFLAGGGTFRLPGSGDIINSMRFMANLDSALGQGALQIGTQFSFFSNNAPVDRTTWETLTNPIQSESLIDRGSLGQNSTININSDLFFRSPDGWGSLVLARRDFNTWGNKNISNEMQRPLNNDVQSLLSYGSAMNFGNRFLGTCSPVSSAQGVVHEAMIGLNFDLISSLRQTLPPAWEGIWIGLNILQVVTGRVNGSIRSFAFTLNLDTNKIELYEILAESTLPTAPYLDNGVTQIKWAFETAVMFNQDVKPLNDLIQLLDGECYLSNIKGDVHVKVMYRPDFMTCWTTWHEFDVCSSVTGQNQQPGYRTRIGLGEPDPAPCEPGNNRQLRIGYFFQFRVEVTGSCTWNGLRASANTKMQPHYAPVACVEDVCQDIECSLPDDLRFYGLQGFPPATPSSPPPFFPYHNNAVTLAACQQGVATFTDQPPPWIIVNVGNLTVVAGTFGGQSQAEADAKATTALSQFIANNLTSGNLTCVAVACTFSPSTLTGTILNAAYSQQLLLSGVIQGTWSIAAGNLPAGLALSSTGLISGTPTVAGSFNIIVNVAGTGINCNWPYTFVVYENMLTNFIEYFTLNETGSANRASTPTNQPLVPTSGSSLSTPGLLGNAFLCQTNVSGNYLRGLNALSNPGEDFNNVSYSLSIWINRLQNITGRTDIYSTRYTETEGCALFFDSSNTQLRWEVHDNLGHTSNGTYVSIPTASTWYHYVVTFDKATQTLRQYLNGVLVATDTGFLIPTATDNSRRMTIAQFLAPTASLFECQAIGLWNTPLTANQVLHLYNNGAGIAYPF